MIEVVVLEINVHDFLSFSEENLLHTEDKCRTLLFISTAGLPLFI